MPAYNAEETLSEILDCILAQRLSDFELLVVDDGSTDSTLSIAREYEARDGRFRVYTKPNGGVASVYNLAIPKAEGEFISIAPADDPLYPEHLSTFARVVDEHPEYDIYCSNGERIFPSGERATTYVDAKHRSAHEIPLTEVIVDSFYAVGVVYRKSLFERLGGYRGTVYCEDWDFWLRAMKLAGARVWYTPEVLSGNRMRPENKSADVVRVFSSDIALLREFEAEFDLTPTEREALTFAIQKKEMLRSRAAGEDGWIGKSRRAVRDRLMSLCGVERVERAVARLKSRR